MAMSAKERNWLKTAARAEALPVADALPEAVEEIEPGEDVHPSQAFGGLWSRRDRAPTVEFRFLDPEKPDESFDYNYLPRVSWHKGKGEIALLFDTLGVTVRIRGLNLQELKERLRQHLVTWVQEQGNDPIASKVVKEQARAEGREFVLVQEIRIEPHPTPPDVPD
jgi:hypothetical protein